MSARLLALALVVVSSSACQADFYGEAYAPVAKTRDIQVHDTLPPGYRIIGDVAAFDEKTVNGNSIIGQARCPNEERMIRRMKRTAADVGGELLVDVICESIEEEDTSWVHDNPDTEAVETELYCMVDCTALVARSLEHNDSPR